MPVTESQPKLQWRSEVHFCVHGLWQGARLEFNEEHRGYKGRKVLISRPAGHDKKLSGRHVGLRDVYHQL